MWPHQHPDFSFWPPARQENLCGFNATVCNTWERAPGRSHHPKPRVPASRHFDSTEAGAAAAWGILGPPLPTGSTADPTCRYTAGSHGLYLPAPRSVGFRFLRGGSPTSVWCRRQQAPGHTSSHPTSSFPALSLPQNRRPEQQEVPPCTGRSPNASLAVWPRLGSPLSTDRATKATSQPLLSSLCEHGITPPDALPALLLVPRTYFGLGLKTKFKNRVKVLLLSFV